MRRLGKEIFYGVKSEGMNTVFEDKVFWASEYPKDFKPEEITEGLKKGHEVLKGDRFDLIWDSTDHFNFLCECGAIPNIVSVQLWGDENNPTIYFGLYCQNCGRSGQRKIYCNDTKEGQIGMMRADRKSLYSKVLEFERC